MHYALALEALQAPTIIVRRARSFGGRIGGCDLGRCDAPLQALRLLLLQLAQCLLDGEGVEDVVGGSRQDGEDGECAVFLVLLEAAAQAVICMSARGVWSWSVRRVRTSRGRCARH